MKKTIIWILVFLLLISAVSAQQIDFAKCYDDDAGEIILLGFVGFLLFALFFISHYMIRIPFINIILGVAIHFYSVSVMLCDQYIGIALFTFGTILVLWEIVDYFR